MNDFTYSLARALAEVETPSKALCEVLDVSLKLGAHS